MVVCVCVYVWGGGVLLKNGREFTKLSKYLSIGVGNVIVFLLSNFHIFLFYIMSISCLRI